MKETGKFKKVVFPLAWLLVMVGSMEALTSYLGSPTHRVMSGKQYNRSETAHRHNGKSWHLLVDRVLESHKSDKKADD